MAPPPPPVNLLVVLSESKRIINAHARHFLALSVLFLLPTYFSATVYASVFRLITVRSAASHNGVYLLHDGGYQPPRAGADTKTVILIRVADMVVDIVFDLLAIGSITYSVFQGFYGRPVKLISAVKSSFASFFPLLATLISTSSIVFGIVLIIGFAAFSLTKLIEIIFPGLEIGLLALSLIVVMIISMIVIVLKFKVDWILACVIVVVESKVWGLTPLKRSKSLIKGMRSVSLSMIFFFVVTELTLGWISRAAASAQIYDNENGKLWTTKAFFVLQIVITFAFQTLLQLYNLAAITVMYIYCKAFHGELALEIQEESAKEYVSLPFDDDGKVTHLVSVAYNNV